jgi:hypothetical protein
MIISASYKTDVPAYYGEWFLNRLAAGYCRTVNPWGGQIYRVPLDAASVDGFVFWTRNAGPFAKGFARVRQLGFPFMVQFTVTGYPRALEPSVPDPATAVAQIRSLAAAFGPRAVVWRYDPVLISSLTPAQFHEENFAALAAALRGEVDEVVISFAHIYRKTQRNLDAAAAAHGFQWHDPPADEKRALCARLGEIAHDAGISLTVCSQPGLMAGPAVAARCIDAGRLGDIAGRALEAREKGNRPGCLCHQSRDIGAYDTCLQGCAYCYAVTNGATARRNQRRHDPNADALLPLAEASAPAD